MREMTSPRTRRNAEPWSASLRRSLASEQNTRAFSRHEGVSLGSLHCWRSAPGRVIGCTRSTPHATPGAACVGVAEAAMNHVKTAFRRAGPAVGP